MILPVTSSSHPFQTALKKSAALLFYPDPVYRILLPNLLSPCPVYAKIYPVMMSILPLMCAAFVFAFSGCFWHAPPQAGQAQAKPSEKPLNVAITLVDAAALKSGGKIAFTPLKAGARASADEQSDRVSLMIIKGMADRIAQSRTSLIIAAPEDEPNLVFQGYIEELLQNSRLKRLVLRREKGRLAISGEIWLSSTGAKVLTFAGYAHLGDFKDVFQAAGALGEALGYEIAAQTR